jgi:hypothetical protein
MSEPDVFVGIDVSKVQLDVALRPTDDHWPVSNDELGIALQVATEPPYVCGAATCGWHLCTEIKSGHGTDCWLRWVYTAGKNDKIRSQGKFVS